MKEHPIGTKVRINCPGSERHGEECTVTSGLQPQRVLCDDDDVRSLLVQDVDLSLLPEDGGIGYAFEPRELTPIYDGNEKVSWSSCVWQPTSIRA